MDDSKRALCYDFAMNMVGNRGHDMKLAIEKANFVILLGILLDMINSLGSQVV